MPALTSSAHRLALIAAAALSVSTACEAQSDRRTVSGSAVAIYNVVGNVRIEPGTGSDVVVEINRAGRDARRLSVDVSEIRGRNSLRVIYPDDDIIYTDMSWRGTSEFRMDRDGTWGGDNRGDRWNDRLGGGRRIRVRSRGSGTEAWADLRIFVPAGKKVDVRLGLGEMTASNVSGDLRLDISSGRLNANGIRGHLDMNTGSGSIDARDIKGEDLRFNTGSGGISMTNVSGGRLHFNTGSGTVSAMGLTADDLDIKTGSGGIRVDDVTAQRLNLDTGSGGIEVGVRNSPKSMEVETGSGGVTVTLPTRVDATVDIQTGSGGIDSEFAVQVNRIERNHLRGTIGDGTGRIRIQSGSGTVRLRKA